MSEAKTLQLPKEQFPSWDYFSVFSRNSNELNSVGSAKRYSFFWARNGIYHALRALRVSPGAHVLLPAYVCTAAVEPFAAFGAEVEFYEIGRDCKPDLAEIESRIGPRTEAILAVHYFGFPQKIHAFRELCDRHKLALVEDCAHVLTGDIEGAPPGTFGDASVFSWRKFLPIYDGAELRLNRRSDSLEVSWNKETIPFTLKVAKCLLDRIFEQSSGGVLGHLSNVLESMKSVWRRANAIPVGQPLLGLDSNQASLDAALLNQRISRVSRFLLRHSDIPAVAKRRRENYLFLQNGFRGMKGIQPLHPNLPPNVCPWVYPLFFDGIANAHFFLREIGIPAVTWGGVRPHGLNPGRYPNADFLYDNLVFLPVHQNLPRRSLDRVVEAVASVAAGRGLETHSRSHPVAMQTSK